MLYGHRPVRLVDFGTVTVIPIARTRKRAPQGRSRLPSGAALPTGDVDILIQNLGWSFRFSNIVLQEVK
jgi:hypothetical protein